MPNLDEDEQWGVRLADIRLPRAWPVPVLAALFLARRQQSRELRDLEAANRDLAQLIAQRWREGDDREDRLIALTNTLTRLTWVLLAVTVVTLVVNIVILLSP